MYTKQAFFWFKTAYNSQIVALFLLKWNERKYNTKGTFRRQIFTLVAIKWKIGTAAFDNCFSQFTNWWFYYLNIACMYWNEIT